MVSVTDPSGRIIGFLDRANYLINVLNYVSESRLIRQNLHIYITAAFTCGGPPDVFK
jgi:hypothetical protein